MFETLIHADWGVKADKRYIATAVRSKEEWLVTGPDLAGPSDALLNRAFSLPSVLLGFDFPIGLPDHYGRKSGFRSFPEALHAFGHHEDWRHFFEIASTPDEISVYRPFYPRSSRKGSKRDHLVVGLQSATFGNLLRVCEKNTGGQDACSLFWTLGGNQVGRGALAGWQEVVRPAMERGGMVWPFDGTLESLGSKGGVTIAETYPALAARLIGIPFHVRESKRRQADRSAKATKIFAWADRNKVRLGEATSRSIHGGFGPHKNGEDAFDALTGLFKMIDVADGRRPATTEDYRESLWEGWILGR